MLLRRASRVGGDNSAFKDTFQVAAKGFGLNLSNILAAASDRSQGSTRNIRDRLLELVSRQIALQGVSLKRVVEVLDPSRLARVIAQEALQQQRATPGETDKALEAARKSLEDQATPAFANIDAFFDPISRVPEETGKKVKEAQVPVIQATREQTTATQAVKTAIDVLKTETQTLRQQQQTQFTQKQAQDAELAASSVEPLKIDDGSKENFIQLFGDKFNEVCALWIQSLNETLQTQSIGVTVAPIEAQLKAEVIQTIQGESFIEQLTAALIGTGLEDRVDLIINALAPLIQTEIERNNPNISGAGEQVISLSGRNNSTSTGR